MCVSLYFFLLFGINSYNSVYGRDCFKVDIIHLYFITACRLEILYHFMYSMRTIQ